MRDMSPCEFYHARMTRRARSLLRVMGLTFNVPQNQGKAIILRYVRVTEGSGFALVPGSLTLIYITPFVRARV